MSLGFQMHLIIEKRDTHGLEKRWGRLCLTELSTLFTSEEAETFQEKLVENQLISLMNCRPLAVELLGECRLRVWFLLQPVMPP